MGSVTPEFFVSLLEKEGTNFYAGVPDSLLFNFCRFMEQKNKTKNGDGNYVIAANEGAAVAIAAGHHLGSGKIGCVFLQNSGLGNCVNPLTSLLDKKVNQIPVLLLIGWSYQVPVLLLIGWRFVVLVVVRATRKKR